MATEAKGLGGRDAVVVGDTPRRILEATVRRIIAGGAAGLSMQDVADEAGISKGLIHYHFHDKDALLAQTIAWVTDESVRREEGALAGSSPTTVVDQLWHWAATELESGRLGVMVALAQYESPEVQTAVKESLQRRRSCASATVEGLFNVVGLKPRVSSQLIGDVLTTFLNGLAVDWRLAGPSGRRVAFDVFWLAVLSLAE